MRVCVCVSCCKYRAAAICLADVAILLLLLLLFHSNFSSHSFSRIHQVAINSSCVEDGQTYIHNAIVVGAIHIARLLLQ